MTREELQNQVDNIMSVMENVQRTLQFTNIPVYFLVNYIKKETGINVSTLVK